MTSPEPAAIPPQAIAAATEWLHDEECDDGDTETCGRWKCGSDPGSQFHSYHVGHVNFYRERATGVLEAAAPHLAAAECVRIAMVAGELKFRLWRPGLGPGADEQMIDVVPFEQLLEALREDGEGGGT